MNCSKANFIIPTPVNDRPSVAKLPQINFCKNYMSVHKPRDLIWQNLATLTKFIMCWAFYCEFIFYLAKLCIYFDKICIQLGEFLSL